MLPLLLEFSGLTQASLRREQQAELAALPVSPDEGKGSPGWGAGGRGGFCTFPPCGSSRRVSPVPWQCLPAAPHPLQPRDPNPWGPPPPALPQPGCSSLIPQGYLGGHLPAHAPLGASRNASGAFEGLP